MKKLLLFALLTFSLVSCGHVSMSDSIKYKVIDTTQTVFGIYPEYNVIIKMDSAYYSARLNSSGKLYKIDRKLNFKIK
jgi:uncharacterized protein YcfL